MSISPINFGALPVRQKDLVFYVSALPAAEILKLGRGIRKEQDAEEILDSNLAPADGKNILEAIEESAFASEVVRISERSYAKSSPFQRVIDQARVKELAAYLLEQDSAVPNAMILATRDDTDVEVSQDGSAVVVKLTWSSEYAVNIIDGQHRIEAIAQLLNEGHEEFSNYTIPLTLLVDLPFYLQAELFAVVNGKQKPVNRSRVYDLFGYQQFSTSEEKERAYRSELAVDRFCHYVVRVMNESKASPWHNRIKMRGRGIGVVTQAALINQLKQLVVPRKNSDRLTTLPVLYPYFKRGDLKGASRACILFFRGVKEAHPNFWGSDDLLKGSLFGTSAGIAVSFMAFHDLAIMDNGADLVTQETSTSLWREIPATVLQQRPSSGGKGIQRSIYEQAVTNVPDFPVTNIAPKFSIMRESLSAEGGLID